MREWDRVATAAAGVPQGGSREKGRGVGRPDLQGSANLVARRALLRSAAVTTPRTTSSEAGTRSHLKIVTRPSSAYKADVGPECVEVNLRQETSIRRSIGRQFEPRLEEADEYKRSGDDLQTVLKRLASV